MCLCPDGALVASDPRYRKSCARCGRVATTKQTNLWLGPCSLCGKRFAVDLEWWWALLEASWEGKTPLPINDCRACAPTLHHGSPVVEQRGE